jgi:hypothetical protein
MSNFFFSRHHSVLDLCVKLFQYIEFFYKSKSLSGTHHLFFFTLNIEAWGDTDVSHFTPIPHSTAPSFHRLLEKSFTLNKEKSNLHSLEFL